MDLPVPPSTFQSYINDALHPFLDRFCTGYLDDILIYSENEEQHIEHVKQILEALTKAGLQVKPQKCEFHTNNVEYLGFMITTEGLRTDPAKITMIIEWPIPKKLGDVRSFLGFGNFYRRFIQDYSHLARPLTQLAKKGTPFVWLHLCQAAFERLKKAFTTTPILIHFDFEKPIVVETDASDIASAGILSQLGPDGLLHLIAFFSKKHSQAECNYNTYDKELMAVVSGFEEWRAYLVGRPVTLQSDYQNLRYFTTKRLLNQRQARWSELCSLQGLRGPETGGPPPPRPAPVNGPGRGVFFFNPCPGPCPGPRPIQSPEQPSVNEFSLPRAPLFRVFSSRTLLF